MPQLKAGQLALNAGAMMAGVEKFKVTVTGVSSHAARPDLGVDTVTAVTNHGSECTIINFTDHFSPLKQLFCPLRT